MNDASVVWIVVALGVLVVAVFGAIALSRRAKMQTAALRERFGPEYDRAVGELGQRRGERALAERVRHVRRIRIRELSQAERARFESEWNSIQVQFVDDPVAAVGRANELVKQLMGARGYSSTDAFEQRVADLSVDHPDVVQHYRAAHALARGDGETGTNTEELRQSIVHYRVIFADLLQPSRVSAPAMRPAHTSS